VGTHESEPIVDEVLRFETVPVDQGGTRRAIVRWSNGSEGTALVWYQDEVLSPVDHAGRQ